MDGAVSTPLQLDPGPKPGYKIQGVDLGSYWEGGVTAVVTEELDRITEAGATWVRFSPVWWMESANANAVRALPSTWSPGLPGTTISDADLRALIAAARERGLEVFLEPTINVDDYSWPGAIAPTDWSAWFESYTTFAAHYARIAEEEGAALYSIGSDLRSTTAHTDRWRTVVAAARGAYSGRVTYSSAVVFDQRPPLFWDDLDVIGIVFQEVGSETTDPTIAEMERAFTADVVGELGPLQAHYGKPVVVTQAAVYNVDGANREPYTVGDPSSAVRDDQEQADYYEGALRAMAAIPWLEGVFWGRWELKGEAAYPNEDVPFTTNPKGKPAEAVLREYYVEAPLLVATDGPSEAGAVGMWNGPNPFRASTTLGLVLPRAGRVTVEVFNVLGQRVATLIDGALYAAGPHQLAWDARGLSSGTYVVRVTMDGEVATRRVSLVR